MKVLQQVAVHIRPAAGGRRELSVANLGDSRAVLGRFEEWGLVTVGLTRDHSASAALEQARLVELHGALELAVC
jgi:serine/threonine protein phosphatase PrpC